jgi:hypothetical protein
MWVDLVVRSVVEVEELLKLAAVEVLALRLEVVEGEPLAMRELGRTRFVLLVLQEKVYDHSSVVEGRVSRVIVIASCRSGMGHSRHRLLAVCSAAPMVVGVVLILRELEALQSVEVVVEEQEVQHQEVEAAEV